MSTAIAPVSPATADTRKRRRSPCCRGRGSARDAACPRTLGSASAVTCPPPNLVETVVSSQGNVGRLRGHREGRPLVAGTNAAARRPCSIKHAAGCACESTAEEAPLRGGASSALMLSGRGPGSCALHRVHSDDGEHAAREMGARVMQHQTQHSSGWRIGEFATPPITWQRRGPSRSGAAAIAAANPPTARTVSRPGRPLHRRNH